MNLLLPIKSSNKLYRAVESNT